MNKLLTALRTGLLSAIQAPLPQRGILHVSGNDANKFLQGLVTHKIDSEQSCIHAAFLNTKGRLLFDSLMYRRDDGKSWLIEVDKSQLPHLTQHLTQYKLRAKINIEPELDKAYRICSLLCANVDQRDKILTYLLNYPASSLQLTFHLDPRHPLFIRMILPHDMEGMPIYYRTFYLICNLSVKFPKSVFVDPLISTETTASSNSIYKWFRTVHGIPEGAYESVSESIPLEMNLDVTDGVHFNKGCYLGQELIARSHHTGVIRKRLLPFIVGSDSQRVVVKPDQLAPEGEDVYRDLDATTMVPAINSDITLINSQEGGDVKTGRVFTTCWNVGFGMCRLEHLSAAAQFQAGASRLGFIKPSWWSQYLKQQEEVSRSINAL